MRWQWLVPDAITYSTLISACEKGKQLQQSKRLYGAMQWQGLVPDVITYSALISACGKGKQHQHATRLYEAMH